MILQQLSDLSGINISKLWFLENAHRIRISLALKALPKFLVDVKAFIINIVFKAIFIDMKTFVSGLKKSYLNNTLESRA